jgi:hypothetical protein
MRHRKELAVLLSLAGAFIAVWVVAIFSANATDRLWFHTYGPSIATPKHVFEGARVMSGFATSARVRCPALRRLWPSGEITGLSDPVRNLNLTAPPGAPVFLVDEGDTDLLVRRDDSIARIRFEPAQVGLVRTCSTVEQDRPVASVVEVDRFADGDVVDVFTCGHDHVRALSAMVPVELSALLDSCSARIEMHRKWETWTVVTDLPLGQMRATVNPIRDGDHRGRSQIEAEIRSHFKRSCSTDRLAGKQSWEPVLRKYREVPVRQAFLENLIRDAKQCPARW